MMRRLLNRLMSPPGFVLFSVLVVVLAFGARGAKYRAAEGPPAYGAHWIWADRTFEEEEPLAFDDYSVLLAEPTVGPATDDAESTTTTSSSTTEPPTTEQERADDGGS